MKRHRLKLAVGLPFEGRYVAPEWAMCLAQLTYPMNVNYAFIPAMGMPRDKARNQIVKIAQEVDAEYLLFLDDDTAPPNYTIQKLMYELEIRDDSYAVCAGVYVTKTNNPEPTVFKGQGTGPYWKWKYGEVFEVWGAATGCMMIRMSAFKKIKKPYFVDIKTIDEAKKYPEMFPAVQELNPLKAEMTDDLFFCERLSQAGLKVLAHGGVLPVHWDQNHIPYLLPENSFPVKGLKLVTGVNDVQYPKSPANRRLDDRARAKVAGRRGSKASANS